MPALDVEGASKMDRTRVKTGLSRLVSRTCRALLSLSVDATAVEVLLATDAAPPISIAATVLSFVHHHPKLRSHTRAALSLTERMQQLGFSGTRIEQAGMVPALAAIIKTISNDIERRKEVARRRGISSDQAFRYDGTLSDEPGDDDSDNSNLALCVCLTAQSMATSRMVAWSLHQAEILPRVFELAFSPHIILSGDKSLALATEDLTIAMARGAKNIKHFTAKRDTKELHHEDLDKMFSALLDLLKSLNANGEAAVSETVYALVNYPSFHATSIAGLQLLLRGVEGIHYDTLLNDGDSEDETPEDPDQVKHVRTPDKKQMMGSPGKGKGGLKMAFKVWPNLARVTKLSDSMTFAQLLVKCGGIPAVMTVMARARPSNAVHSAGIQILGRLAAASNEWAAQIFALDGLDSIVKICSRADMTFEGFLVEATNALSSLTCDNIHAERIIAEGALACVMKAAREQTTWKRHHLATLRLLRRLAVRGIEPTRLMRAGAADLLVHVLKTCGEDPEACRMACLVARSACKSSDAPDEVALLLVQAGIADATACVHGHPVCYFPVGANGASLIAHDEDEEARKTRVAAAITARQLADLAGAALLTSFVAALSSESLAEITLRERDDALTAVATALVVVSKHENGWDGIDSASSLFPALSFYPRRGHFHTPVLHEALKRWPMLPRLRDTVVALARDRIAQTPDQAMCLSHFNLISIVVSSSDPATILQGLEEGAIAGDTTGIWQAMLLADELSQATSGSAQICSSGGLRLFQWSCAESKGKSTATGWSLETAARIILRWFSNLRESITDSFTGTMLQALSDGAPPALASIMRPELEISLRCSLMKEFICLLNAGVPLESFVKVGMYDVLARAMATDPKSEELQATGVKCASLLFVPALANPPMLLNILAEVTSSTKNHGSSVGIFIPLAAEFFAKILRLIISDGNRFADERPLNAMLASVFDGIAEIAEDEETATEMVAVINNQNLFGMATTVIDTYPHLDAASASYLRIWIEILKNPFATGKSLFLKHGVSATVKAMLTQPTYRPLQLVGSDLLNLVFDAPVKICLVADDELALKLAELRALEPLIAIHSHGLDEPVRALATSAMTKLMQRLPSYRLILGSKCVATVVETVVTNPTYYKHLVLAFDFFKSLIAFPDVNANELDEGGVPVALVAACNALVARRQIVPTKGPNMNLHNGIELIIQCLQRGCATDRFFGVLQALVAELKNKEDEETHTLLCECFLKLCDSPQALKPMLDADTVTTLGASLSLHLEVESVATTASRAIVSVLGALIHVSPDLLTMEEIDTATTQAIGAFQEIVKLRSDIIAFLTACDAFSCMSKAMLAHPSLKVASEVYLQLWMALVDKPPFVSLFTSHGIAAAVKVMTLQPENPGPQRAGTALFEASLKKAKSLANDMVAAGAVRPLIQNHLTVTQDDVTINCKSTSVLTKLVTPSTALEVSAAISAVSQTMIWSRNVWPQSGVLWHLRELLSFLGALLANKVEPTVFVDGDVPNALQVGLQKVSTEPESKELSTCLRVLSDLLAHGCETSSFRKAGILTSLAAVLRTHLGDARMVEAAIGPIYVLCDSPDAPLDVFTANVIPQLRDALKKHPIVDYVVEPSLKTLHAILEQAGSGKGLPETAPLDDRWDSALSQVFEAACAFVGLVGKRTDAAALFENFQVLASASNAMKMRPTLEHASTAFVITWHNLMWANGRDIVDAKLAREQFPAISAPVIIQAAINQPDNKPLHAEGVKLMMRAQASDRTVIPELVKHGVIKLLATSYSACITDDNFCHATDTVSAFAGDPSLAERVVADGGIAVVLNSIVAHPEFEKHTVKGFAFARMLLEQKIPPASLISAGVPQILVTLLGSHPAEALQLVTQLVDNDADHGEFRECFGNAGTILRLLTQSLKDEDLSSVARYLCCDVDESGPDWGHSLLEAFETVRSCIGASSDAAASLETVRALLSSSKSIISNPKYGGAFVDVLVSVFAADQSLASALSSEPSLAEKAVADGSVCAVLNAITAHPELEERSAKGFGYVRTLFDQKLQSAMIADAGVPQALVALAGGAHSADVVTMATRLIEQDHQGVLRIAFRDAGLLACPGVPASLLDAQEQEAPAPSLEAAPPAQAPLSKVEAPAPACAPPAPAGEMDLVVEAETGGGGDTGPIESAATGPIEIAAVETQGEVETEPIKPSKAEAY